MEGRKGYEKIKKTDGFESITDCENKVPT